MENKSMKNSIPNLGESLAEERDQKKKNVANISRGILTWERDTVFTARIRGHAIDFDAEAQEGCTPTDSLLMSLPGCMGIDIVMILRKMKAEIQKLEIEAIGEKNPTPPNYFKAIHLKIRIAGKGITTKKLEKAISLSQKKYCSVLHSLREDMRITVTYEIEKNE